MKKKKKKKKNLKIEQFRIMVVCGHKFISFVFFLAFTNDILIKYWNYENATYIIFNFQQF